MNCQQARDALLDAEPAELRGEAPGGLSLHLKTCADCAARARTILEGMQSLEVSLAELSAAPLPRRAVRVRSWARRVLPLGLAAAAALAGLLMVRRGPPALGGPPSVASPVTIPRGVEVDLSGARRDVAVFETADSTITVVWYF